MLVWAAPSSDEFIEEDIGKSPSNMGTFQGDVYVVGIQRQIFKLVAPAEQNDGAVVLIAQVPLSVDDVDLDDEGEGYIGLSFHLVEESLGELLLIRHSGRAVKVFRVDVVRRSLEEVKSLGGSHAMFLGAERCMSVDASNLPSIDANCVYLFQWIGKTEYMCVYNLRDDMMEIISRKNNPDRPFSLAQVLLRYCDFHDL